MRATLTTKRYLAAKNCISPNSTSNIKGPRTLGPHLPPQPAVEITSHLRFEAHREGAQLEGNKASTTPPQQGNMSRCRYMCIMYSLTPHTLNVCASQKALRPLKYIWSNPIALKMHFTPVS